VSPGFWVDMSHAYATENCLIGAINADSGEANKVLNQVTGDFGPVPTVGA